MLPHPEALAAPATPTSLTAAVAGQPIDPKTILATTGPVRAAGSFLLMVVLGAAVLRLFEADVDAAIDASLDRPVTSTIYGLIAHGSVGVATAYAYSFVASAGTLAAAGLAVVALAWLIVAAVGFLVTGGVITGAVGSTQPWTGLVFGAAIAAAAWLLPSVAAGVAVWFVAVSLGIGGRTREWVHASRSTSYGGDGRQ
ncbi:hypothetical protein BRC94_08870 [Halobacteriales archaeon QS_5_70_17]|nr:MAG: hypothetical protein BRC94_08870 [Halobacteriales archaeon QS_5_70_17]